MQASSFSAGGRVAAAPPRVAVVGAGMAGATCARQLADAGCDVAVFDKARGVGGRMATRRVDGVALGAQTVQARLDHGALGFTARGADFQAFLAQACRDQLAARWDPRVAPGSCAPLDAPGMWVATPDMPALCRALLAGVPVHTGQHVQALQPGADGWALHGAASAEEAPRVLASGFDAVVLTVPMPQAVVLLQAHQPEWARRARALPMPPVWALMGLAQDDAPPPWDLAWPARGPLAWVVRTDTRPGRQVLPGCVPWVVHARADWSQTHLALSPDEMQPLLLDALAPWLGRPTWLHLGVHRWRYATAEHTSLQVPGPCWLDAAQGLGVCGDALGGGGVEGAWRSGQALAQQLLVQLPQRLAARGRGPGTGLGTGVVRS